MAGEPEKKKGKSKRWRRKGQHFLVSPEARNFTLAKIDKLTDLQVIEHFAAARWGGGTTQVCPTCGSIAIHYWISTRCQWRCRELGCSRTFSVTSGTKFADHKLPLRTILKAMVLFANNVKGISASALTRILGVAYMTAFVLLHKIRESIVEGASKQKLDGLIQIDGAHLSGRTRKGRVKKDATKTEHREKEAFGANPNHPNRRIIMVMRQVDDSPDRLGATRTIVEVVKRENREHVEALTKQYVESGARVMTDELAAYNYLGATHDHQTVNHSKEFSTGRTKDDRQGVNNNQAESYFSRLRRMVWGQIHRLMPKYMHDYITEVAWREDMRRTPTSKQVESLLQMSMQTRSRWWRGYWQGYHRKGEVMFVP